MPPTDESLLTDDDDVERDDIEIDDESLDSDADEEMSGEDEDESDDDLSARDDDEDEDAADLPISTREADLQRKLQQYEYQEQQKANKAYWEDIESQAADYFEWKINQIEVEKHNYLDPDAYAREETRKVIVESKSWYKQFFANIDQARRVDQERKMLPVYAARVATHYELTPEQAQELLEYHPERMAKEAEKFWRYNQIAAKTTSSATQKKRSTAQKALIGKVPNSGSGRSTSRVKAGSDAHLKSLLGMS